MLGGPGARCIHVQRAWRCWTHPEGRVLDGSGRSLGDCQALRVITDGHRPRGPIPREAGHRMAQTGYYYPAGPSPPRSAC
jgi:hypothetical protein